MTKAIASIALGVWLLALCGAASACSYKTQASADDTSTTQTASTGQAADRDSN